MAETAPETEILPKSGDQLPGTSGLHPSNSDVILSEESVEERPARIGSTQRFTQDPMEIHPAPAHSQIPTPETASVKECDSSSDGTSNGIMHGK
ncbi:hypothetical protein GCK32_002810, partial [Trichostrongylus colubriformis]